MSPAKEEDPRAWLRPKVPPPVEGSLEDTRKRPATQRTTGTLYKSAVFQNTLQAVPYPHKMTGYKDARDPCNRTDKHYGGAYRQFASTNHLDFAPVNERPVKFREDGIPVSARIVDDKPLMAPKLPTSSELSTSKRLMVEYNHKSRVQIGSRDRKDSRRFSSVYQLVHTAPQRMLAQPNPGIAAEQAKAAHQKLGLFD